MNLEEFLAGNERIDVIEIISFELFPPRLLPPSFVGLIGLDGRAVYLAAEMREIHERLELGLLKIWEKNDPSKSGTKVLLPGGKVLSWNYLAAPGYEFISGVVIKLDNGELVVTAAATPCAIFASFGDFRIENPEYSIEEYRNIGTAMGN